MDINLEKKNRTIKDADIKKKFEEFSNGFFNDIAMELYEKDGKYFLNLAPYTDKILNSNMCITASSKSELESVIEDLSCNIGIMLAEKSGKIQKNETDKQIVQIGGKEVSLLDFDQVYIGGKNGNTELYKEDELTEKIKSISSKVFGSEKDLDMSSYVKNTMFTRMNGKHTLEKEDFELLKYYKEEGYEFLNSFLGNGELKTRGNIEKEHIGKEFIDNLYKIDKLFEKFPALDESITVYRGATTKNSSDNIEYSSFVSTSLDRSVAENNFSKGRLYQINLPKGTHYIPMDAINGFEGMYGESEAEILLRPSSFNVMNKEMERDTEVLSVNAKEKGNFSEIIRKSLESKKEEIIKKGLCDEDVDKTLSLLKPCRYNETIRVNDNVKITFLNNGHLVGAALILVQISYPEYEDINLLFTGDYNNKNMFFDVNPIPKWILELPLTVIQESTYGDMDSTEIKEIFKENIKKCIESDGTVLTLVFSLGRAQEILYEFKCMQENCELDSNIPIYFDGKLAIRYTNLYIKDGLGIKPEMKDFLPQNLTFVDNESRSDVLKSTSKKIIVTTSGMGSYGPAQVYIPEYISRSNTLIHFTGYTAEGTMGGKLKNAETGSMVEVGGLIAKKRANVEYTTEYSAHAKADEMIEFLKQFKNLKLVLVNHGESQTKNIFAERIVEEVDAKRVGLLGREYFFRIDSYGLVKTLSTKFQ